MKWALFMKIALLWDRIVKADSETVSRPLAQGYLILPLIRNF